MGLNPINFGFDEVETILMVNEDCNSIFDSEVDNETINKMLSDSALRDVDDDILDKMISGNANVEVQRDKEVDDEVKAIMYDEQLDDATTIEDMAAQDMMAARDIGYETGYTVDDDVLDMIFGDEFDKELDTMMESGEGGIIDNVVIV